VPARQPGDPEPNGPATIARSRRFAWEPPAAGTRASVHRSRFLAIAVLSGAIAGCGGDDGSAERSPATTPAPEAAATPAPSPLTFGSHRYVSPCSVLPMDAAERIYGPMNALGYVRQEFYDRSLTTAELRRKTATVTGSVRTVCDYNRRDARNTTVHVEVDQHRSEKTARSAWASIAYLGTGKESRRLAKRDFTGPGWDFNFIKKLARENERNMGGKRVKGIDDVLYVKGRADFVGFRGNALVRLSYLPLGFSTPVFTPSQYRKQAAKAKQAFRVIDEQMDRADLAQQPLGPVVGGEQEVNGVPYLDPCSVLNEKVFELATGRAPTEPAESVSLPVDTAGLREAADELYGQSPEATCSRRARHKRKPSDATSRSDHADLSVRVAARPQGDEVLSVGTELAQDWMINRYVNKDARDRVTTRDLVTGGVVEQITADDTDADALYVFDSTAKTGRKQAFRRAFFNVGPYAFMLAVTRNSSLDLYSGKDLGVTGYRKVVDAIAADVRARHLSR